jgi:hypothetical protein
MLSVMRLSVSQESKIVVPLERLLAEKDAVLEQQARRISQLEQLEQSFVEKDALLEQQAPRVSQLEQHVSECKARLAELERILQATYDSRSWKVTAPLRNMMTWLRH